MRGKRHELATRIEFLRARARALDEAILALRKLARLGRPSKSR